MESLVNLGFETLRDPVVLGAIIVVCVASLALITGLVARIIEASEARLDHGSLGRRRDARSAARKPRNRMTATGY